MTQGLLGCNATLAHLASHWQENGIKVNARALPTLENGLLLLIQLQVQWVGEVSAVGECNSQL